VKQMVVGLLVVVGVFTVGPWFAGRVGPPLADAITEWAAPEQPCATATAEPTKKARPHKHRPHHKRVHKPRDRHDEQHTKRRHPRAPRPTPTCAPTPGPSPSR
jgi:hypothetical protein